MVRINLPLLLLAPNDAVLGYFTSALEAPLVQIAAAVFALVVLRPVLPAAQIAAGCAPLVRHALAPPLILLARWCWRRNRRLPLPLGSLSSTGAGLLFRAWYCADLLPNTFYLKDDWIPARGLVYLADTAGRYDAAVHRHHPDLAHDPWAGAAGRNLKEAYRRAGVAPADRPYDDIDIHHWCFAMYAEPDGPSG